MLSHRAVQPLLTYDEASKLLAIPRGTLQWMVHENRIPHIRRGPRTVRFRLDDLEAWIERCQRGELP